MSTRYKLLILLLLIIVSGLGYQNCGNQQLQGDEASLNDPDPEITIGDGPGVDMGQLPQEFQVELTCPTSSSNSKFIKIEFGTLMGADTYRITDFDNVQRSFGWNSSRPIYIVNTPWDADVTLLSIELQNKVATIKFRSGNVEISEIFPCL